MLRGILISILLYLTSSLYAQKCTDFHLSFCPIPDFSYYYNQQSTSIPLKVGEAAELSIVAYDKTDYFISICKHRKFQTLQLRILEDNEYKDLLYDNSVDAYVDTIKFSNYSTRKLILELLLPEEKNDPSDNKYRCVGVMIATKMRQL